MGSSRIVPLLELLCCGIALAQAIRLVLLSSMAISNSPIEWQTLPSPTSSKREGCPRIIFLDQESFKFGDGKPAVRRLVEPMSTMNHTETTDEEAGKWEQPRSNWHPTCNQMHTVPLHNLNATTFHFSENTGTQRLSISLKDDVFDEPEVHLRVLRFARNLTAKDYHRQTVDATAMDRLNSSPFVVNPYVICGLSIVSEHMGIFLRSRVRRKDKPARRRLQLAVQVAQVVADTHEAGIAHMDLQMKNYFLKDRTAHLNDFNLGQIVGVGRPQPVKGIEGYQHRPPELLNGTVYPDSDPRKFDVYALGNVLFEVWTRRNPYEDLDMSNAEIAQRKVAGFDPPVPARIMTQAITDISIELRAIQEASRACFRPKPSDRPTARQVAAGLESVYQKLLQNTSIVDVTDELAPYLAVTID